MHAKWSPPPYAAIHLGKLQGIDYMQMWSVTGPHGCEGTSRCWRGAPHIYQNRGLWAADLLLGRMIWYWLHFLHLYVWWLKMTSINPATIQNFWSNRLQLQLMYMHTQTNTVVSYNWCPSHHDKLSLLYCYLSGIIFSLKHGCDKNK